VAPGFCQVIWDKQKTDIAMPPGGVLAVDTDLTDGRYVGVRSSVLESKAHVCVEFMVDTEDAMWEEVERVMADTATRLVITPALHLHLPTNLERRSSGHWLRRTIEVFGTNSKNDRGRQSAAPWRTGPG
jgi:hypothetical protein